MQARFYKALEAGNIQEIDQLLSSGQVSINTTFFEGKVLPISVAAYSGQLEVIKLLTDKYQIPLIDVNKPDNNFLYNVCLTQEPARQAILEWLLENDRYKQLAAFNISRAHILAAAGILSLAIAQSPNYKADNFGLKPKDYLQISGIHFASDNDQYAIVRSVNFTEKYASGYFQGETLDFLLTRMGRVGLLRTYMLANEDRGLKLNFNLDGGPNDVDNQGITVAWLMAVGEQFQLLREYHTRGMDDSIDLNAQPKLVSNDHPYYQMTLAFLLAKSHQWDLLKLLLAKDKDQVIEIKNVIKTVRASTGEVAELSLEDILIANEQTEILQDLRNRQQNKFVMLLEKSNGLENLSEIEQTLAEGAKVNEVSSFFRSRNIATNFAMQHGNLPLVKFLVEKYQAKLAEADIPFTNSLFWACHAPIEQRKALLNWLLEDAQIKALEVCQVKREHILAALGRIDLSATDIDLTAADSLGLTIWHYLILSGVEFAETQQVQQILQRLDFAEQVASGFLQGERVDYLLMRMQRYDLLNQYLTRKPKLMLDFNAKPSDQDNLNAGLTLAWIATFRRQTDLLKQYLSQNEDKRIDLEVMPLESSSYSKGITLAWLLACQGEYELLKTLLQHNKEQVIDLTAKPTSNTYRLNGNDLSLLQLLIHGKQTAIVENLLQRVIAKETDKAKQVSLVWNTFKKAGQQDKFHDFITRLFPEDLSRKEKENDQKKAKKKPVSVKSTKTDNTPMKPVVIEDKVIPIEQKLTNQLQELFQDVLAYQLQPSDNNNKMTLLFTGDKTLISNLYNLISKDHKIPAKLLQEKGISKCQIINKTTTLLSLFENQKFIKVVKENFKKPDKGGMENSFISNQNQLMPLVIADGQISQWEKSIHAAFCDANEVKVKCDKTASDQAASVFHITCSSNERWSVREYRGKVDPAHYPQYQLPQDFVEKQIISRINDQGVISLTKVAENTWQAKVYQSEAQALLQLHERMYEVIDKYGKRIVVNPPNVTRKESKPIDIQTKVQEANAATIKQLLINICKQKLLKLTGKEDLRFLDISQNKKSKWLLSFNYQGAKLLGQVQTGQIDTKEFFAALVTAINSIAPGMMRFVEGQNEAVKIVMDFTQHSFPAISAELTALQEKFLQEYKKLTKIKPDFMNDANFSVIKPGKEGKQEEEEEDKQAEIKQAVKSAEGEDKEAEAKQAVQPGKEGKQEEEDEEEDKQALVNQAPVKQAIRLDLSDVMLENLQLHINTMEQITAPTAITVNHEAYYLAYLLNAERMFGTLGKGFCGLEADNIFYQWRNVIRHAAERLNWQDFYQMVHPLILEIGEEITKAKQNQPLVMSFFAVPNPILNFQVMVDTLQQQLAPFEAELARKTLGKSQNALAEKKNALTANKKLLAEIKATDLPDDWKCQAIVMLHSLMGEKRSRNVLPESIQAYQDLHSTYNEKFTPFIDRLYYQIDHANHRPQGGRMQGGRG